MALALGLENKRNVAIAIVLIAVLIGVAYYVFFSGPSAPPPPSSSQTSVATSAVAFSKAPVAGADAEKLSNAGIDPALHFDKLAASEDVRYEGTGRNIFSAESIPVAIPQPIKSARNTQAQLPQIPVGPPPPPPPPEINLKYFGYEQDNDKSYRAFFVHGDDIFIAHTGEIVDHRYKVGVIHPLNVVVTDLSYNNTQTLSLASF
ncbi:MAG: hypothetical protein ABSD59_06965 [Terracidiphilus sp.]